MISEFQGLLPDRDYFQPMKPTAIVRVDWPRCGTRVTAQRKPTSYGFVKLMKNFLENHFCLQHDRDKSTLVTVRLSVYDNLIKKGFIDRNQVTWMLVTNVGDKMCW